MKKSTYVKAESRRIWYEGYEHRLNQRIHELEQLAIILFGSHWTYRQVAEASGLCYQTVCKLFGRDTKLPSDSTMDRLSQAHNAMITFVIKRRAKKHGGKAESKRSVRKVRRRRSRSPA